MTETVIITGRDLKVEQPSLFDQRKALADDREAERHRHRREDMTIFSGNRPPDDKSPMPTEIDLLATITALGRCNPYWSDEANAWAEAHPEIRPKDAAKRWRKHRIEKS